MLCDTTRIFADGADLESIRTLAQDQRVSGFTTNPTLMRRAGLTDYRGFAEAVLASVAGQPVSFEVLADDPAEIVRQAEIICGWAENVYTKVPVTTTRGESLLPTVRYLSNRGVKVNVTAVLTLEQVRGAVDAVVDGAPAYVSVFAGRIADAGADPVPVMAEAVELLREAPAAELIWASPREILNVVQANRVGCDIITITPALLAKLDLLGASLEEYSLETVRMFYKDAAAAGLQL